MDTLNSKKTDKSLLQILGLMFKWMGKYWFLFLVSFGMLYVVQYFRTIVPLFGQHIIDVVLKMSANPVSMVPKYLQGFLQADTQAKQLFLAALMLIIIAFVRAVFIFFQRYVIGVYSEGTAYNLRNKLYTKLQNADYYFHSHSETGDIIQRCTTDVDTYKNFIANQIIEVLRIILLIGLTIWQMARMDVNLMFISVAITPIIFITAIFYFNKIRRSFTVIEQNEAKMTTHVQENVSGSRVVKAFANESFEVDKFEGLNRKFTNSDFGLAKKLAWFWSSTDLICFVQYILIAVMGAVYASNGTISLGEYIAFLTYAGNVVWPMRQLGRIVGDFSKTTVAIQRLNKIIGNPEEYDETEPNLTPEIAGNVKFENVSFKFIDSTENQIEDVSFEVKSGETVAIIGKTGSGKTTLMNLLIRLLDYQNGHITIDGTEIRDIEKHYLRQNIGMILQEPFLFSKTVEENIGIADKEVDNGRVQNVAQIAQVHNDIINFEQGYKTLVGERGITLSGGQKQRVAIARMLLKPKPILIFDDSLSAVDTETDIQIRRALNDEWKDSTVFIITHRITTAREADRILVVEDGMIKEEGKHEDLVKREGLYKTIWEIQSRVDFQIEEEGGEVA